MIHELNRTGFVFETDIEEARVKYHEAWLAYGYDPAMPQPDVEDDDEGDLGSLRRLLV